MNKYGYVIAIIIVCVIMYMCIFIAPMHTFASSIDELTTVAKLERSLCNYRKRNHYVPKKQECPPNGFVTIKPGARLGNKMWEYISVWAVAKTAGIDAYVPGCLRYELDNTFDSLTVSPMEAIYHCLVDLSAFAKSLEEWNQNNDSCKGIMVKHNAFQAELAMAQLVDVKKQFTFKKQLHDKSQHILRTLVKNSTDKVFVGVHIRRTDYVSFYLKYKYNIKPANSSYYYSAMRYFEEKYTNAVFIIASDDIKWCDEQFSNKSNAIVIGKRFKNSPSLDLAILAACNHSIIDYGTYGGWAAVLAGGETIFYSVKGALTERLSKLLPNWLPLT